MEELPDGCFNIDPFIPPRILDLFLSYVLEIHWV